MQTSVTLCAFRALVDMMARMVRLEPMGEEVRAPGSAARPPGNPPLLRQAVRPMIEPVGGTLVLTSPDHIHDSDGLP